MGEWVKYFILIIMLTGFPYEFYSQDPPPPMMESNNDPPICDGYDYDPTTPDPPPPPGLPCITLPIDDYIFPMLFLGLAFGAFQLARLKKKQEELENLTQ